MNLIGIYTKLVIVLILPGIIISQIDPIEEPQCIIEGLTSVICRTYEDFDIREEFELISSTHPNDEKLFEQLIIYYLPVHELPDNTFFDLQFKQISIHETFNLTSIHTNAFNSTSAVTENLQIIGTKVLVNNPPDYDLYAAISSLTNLKTVTINLNDDLKHEIPENAFRQINGPQSNLEVIAFRGDFVISRINNNAFSAIPNLRRWILFSYIQIESISSGAFDFAQTSSDTLELHMNGCGLNESSFEDNIFSGSQRPLLVNLDSNQIRYIRQNTFNSFFNANPNNSISLANNPLDCDNTQEVQWLLDQRDQLQNRVLNAGCSDGTLLWDIGFDDQCDATTDTTEIVCAVNGSLALKSEFKRIAQTNPTQTYYGRLIIEENPIFTVIPDDVFMGLSFGDIFIDSSPNLMNIHRNAFASTANTTHRFWLSSVTQLRNTPPEFDLYYALSTLTNATYIVIALDPSLTHLIPDNAFRNINGVQSNIFEILFQGFRISRIGNNAFYEIPSLQELMFEFTPITRISARAFDFRESSDVTLAILLPDCQLTDQSFEPNMFNGSQRPLSIDLRNNLINYLDENIFSSFLAADSRNQMNLFGNFLNCSDINRFIWLLQQKDQLESRVLDARCTDNTNLWDLEIPSSPPTGTVPTEPPINPIEQPQCIIEGLTSVICRSYEDFNIREEFELISSTHPNDEKLFDQLIIYYLPVHELPDNTFFDLQFTQISIHETFNLTSIHTNAFNSTSAVTENLYLIGTKVLVNNPPDYDLYAAISSLTNLKTVTINLNDDLKHEIPENAFRQINGPQSNLEVIAFRGDFVISRINSNAFSAIPNLRRWILFSYIQIESISSGAFDFAQTSSDRLELHFKGCGLNETSFEDNVFSGSQRPLYIDLDSNQIQYIRQNTFSSFFNANPNNSISLANNPLDCDNTQEVQWLLDQRDQLQNRVINAGCSDGTLLWDIGFDDQCDATTDTTEVVCAVNGSLALKSEFKRIAQTNPTQTYYGRLIIEENPIFTVIPDDVFMGLSFGDIFIDSSPNLMNIHRNAFNSTAHTTHRFVFSTITQLRNTPPEYDVYYALSTLVNATYFLLAFDPSVSHIIPDNAFRNVNGVQSSLYEIIFEGGFNISRIGNNAFYEIPSLEFIVFEAGSITSVSSRAFDFSISSETTLRINIHGSQLTHQSFEANVFSGSQRPLIVDLSDNQINYIEENAFSAFLAADQTNELILSGNSLNCTDIERFRWLLVQKEQLESRVTNAVCNDNTNLWDLELGICDVNWPQDINCRTEQYFDIRAEFQRISNSQSNDQKHFERLIIYYVPISELPENAFYDISFTEIDLHEMFNMTTINTNAFNGTLSTEGLLLSETNALTNNPPNGDLYSAISSLTNLKTVTINLANNIEHEIPTDAFKQINGPQNSLEEIVFRGGFSISRISDNAFRVIPNLRTWFLFSFVPILYISSQAFDFEQSSTDRLEIHLNGCELNQTSFDNNVFSGSQRPLYIDLNSNQIQYIREISFRAFIDANPANNVTLDANPLECDDISEFEWILSRRAELQNRILNAVCRNGTSLWDLELPETPSTLPPVTTITPPPQEGICDVNWPVDIECQTDQYFDIRAEFQRISNSLPNDQKHFGNLLIYAAPIIELPENAFYDITFTDIEFHEMNSLTTIHTNAFNGTSSLTEFLLLSETNALTNNPPNGDLYSAISSLSILQTVTIDLANNILHEIPTDAFQQINGAQNSLAEIAFRGGFSISRISDNAFRAVPNLTWLLFSYVPVLYISSQAFDFDQTSTVSLEIHLNGCELNQTSFDNNVFSGSQRPLYIDLNSNQIQYFRESSFRAFIDSNPANNVSLDVNPLECDDISEFEWILSRRAELQNRILNAVCRNGTSLWDLELPSTPPTGPTPTTIEPPIDPIEQPQCIIEGQTSVICRTYEDFDIREEFELISSTHPNDEKLFDQLIIYYLPVHELPDITFFDLQFTQISIHETFNLTSIHTNAFNSTSAVTENLYLIGTKVLVNNPPDYDLYAAISSLTNLKTVTINLNDDLKHEIPENAFRQINGPQSNLEVIAFRGDFVISRINSNAFSAIPNLRRWILFSYIQIESISSGAFDFAQTSSDRLELHFKGCGLNETSFEDNVFSGSQRPLYIDLDSNQIQYIRQNTFSSFFNANPNNSISLANNPLDCDNTQEVQWLLDQRDQLQNRVINAGCSDGTLLWDIGFDDQCDATTDTTEIVCAVNGSLALKSEFKRIAQANPTQTYYEKLFVENNPLFTVIPENVFMGLSFGDIFIDSSPNLMNIHRNAFNSTANTTHRFWLSTLTQLQNTPPEYDVYYALSTLVNATYFLLAFNPSVSHLIPDNAFRNVNGVQSSLYEILFEGNFNISRIGNNAFYEIPTLEYIVFEVGRITTVSSRAFDFRTSSNTTLRINLHGSLLTHQSFEANVFSGSQRPLIVDLENNTINYIENNTFSAFLAADQRNELILRGNSLNCTDIESFMWLLDQKEELESRVMNAECSDGSNFWDLLTPTPPPQEGICDVNWPVDIECQTDQFFDIRAEFQRISNSLPNDQKHFGNLLIYAAPIIELPENAFYDITFTDIEFHEMNSLTTIHTNAFNGTSSLTEFLLLSETNALTNNPPNGDLYSAISSLSILQTVTIDLANNILHEIPTDAFQQINGAQNSLAEIAFRGGFSISRISDNAFRAVPNLTWLLFSYVPVLYISSQAFDFDQTSTVSLEIHLNGCELNQTSFDNNVFSGSQRPLYIDLNSNQIQYFRESSFRAFIDANPANNVSLDVNPLECDDISEFEWILSRRAELQNRILNAVCRNGTSLWDLELPSTLPPVTTMTPPPQEGICDVNWPVDIECQTDQYFDIRAEFQRISNSLPNDQKHFGNLLIYAAPIIELPENAFYDITFTDIEFHEMNSLTTIHTNAFNGTSSLTEFLLLSETNALTNNPPNGDLYSAISSLSILQTVTIDLANNILHEIPTDAFQQINGAQNSLAEIAFRGGFSISRISDNAFRAVPNLTWLLFSYVPVLYISSQAFDFDQTSTVSLEIHLNGCELNQTSFDNNVFSGSQRPLYIDLNSNQIQYFRESSFRAFIDSNPANNVSLDVNPLECDDISEFEWILSRRAELQNRILNAVCRNGTSLWDLELPETPSTLPPVTTITPPPQEGICEVNWPVDIECQTDQYFDIRAEFQRISNSLPSDQKHFGNLLIYAAPIGELPENAFYDISFTDIEFHEMNNLTTIHTNAFNGTSNRTEFLLLSETNALTNNPPNGDLYSAISSLNNLITVTLDLANNTAHEIPTEAFKQINGAQNSLAEIAFRGSFSISRISDNAFSAIPNLRTWLLFSYVPILYISSKAFDFDQSSTDRLEIHLNGCDLNQTSFDNDVFSGSQRPLYIDLNSNQIQYFRESSFRAFIDANPANTVTLEVNPLECDDISEFEWILSRRAELQNRILNAVCRNGTSLWDLELPETPTTQPTTTPSIASNSVLVNYILLFISFIIFSFNSL